MSAIDWYAGRSGASGSDILHSIPDLAGATYSRVPDTHLFCPACEDFTADGAAICQRCGAQAFLPNAGDPRRLQEILGQAYEVRRPLGEGTFGVVHEVYDRPLNRLLAIKVLKTPTRDLLTRFGLEAEILAQLRHPNIVPLHFVGSQRGVAFMVMPKLSGIPLRNALQRGVPLAEWVRITTQVASALDLAHDGGVIHRDIKPENIFMETTGQASVMDFGIAKIVQPDGPLRTASTVIGTPEYMSPEQIQGDGAIDRRADVYSLGCLVHEMVSGSVPFRRGRQQTQTVLVQHIQQPPPPLRGARDDVPARFEAAVLRALAKQREDRFPTAGAFAAELRDSLKPAKRSWWRPAAG
jgi:eukaryotic-like serine/threonine-protein kinase